MTREATTKVWRFARRRLRSLVGISLSIGALVTASCDRHPAVRDVSAQALMPGETLATDGLRATAGRQASKLRVYRLQIAQGDLMALENQSFANESRPAIFTFEGRKYSGVKVRIRGSWSRSWPKKSLKILFDHSTPFEGHHSLNLNSGWRDPAFIREPLAYHVYAACGVPAPGCRMIRLEINGQFAGVYVEVEQPEKTFLGRIGTPGASVYKAVSRGRDADERDLGSDEAYRAGYNKETKKTEGYSELELFCRDLQTSTNAAEFFAQRVDLDHYINYLAATVLIQHWDGFNKNHFLVYDERGSKKWLVVPWDLDRTFGDHWNWSFDETRLPLLLGTRRLPGITGWNRLEDRFFSDAELKARFVERLGGLLDQEFTEAKLFPVLDKMEMEITPDAQADRQKWPGSTQDFHEGIKQVKAFIRDRRAFLKQEIERLRKAPAGSPR
jgi:spore coat protein H